MKRSVAVIIAARPLFMSAAPRPYSMPSRTTGSNGSVCHSSRGPGRHDIRMTGEAQQRPLVAVQRPEILDRPERHALDPKADSFQPLAR